MSDRERAVQLLNSVPDDKIAYVIGFIQESTIIEEMEIPNKETVEAIEELKNGGGEVVEGSAYDFLQVTHRDLLK